MARSSHNDTIDILKLYSTGSTEKWNTVLSACYDENNVEGLNRIRIGLQRGMDQLVKQKLNSEKICTMYLRWVHSLERTMKAIVKRTNPTQSDIIGISNNDRSATEVQRKRDRDNQLEKFLQRSSY